MATLFHKVKLYLEENGKTKSEIGQTDANVQLADNGDGVQYIKVWNVSGVAEPTAEQLDSYNTNATKDYNNNAIRLTRKRAYGNIGDQLDEIFKDIDAWKVRIQAIKDANAKE